MNWLKCDRIKFASNDILYTRKLIKNFFWWFSMVEMLNSNKKKNTKKTTTETRRIISEKRTSSTVNRVVWLGVRCVCYDVYVRRCLQYIFGWYVDLLRKFRYIAAVHLYVWVSHWVRKWTNERTNECVYCENCVRIMFYLMCMSGTLSELRIRIHSQNE